MQPHLKSVDFKSGCKHDVEMQSRGRLGCNPKIGELHELMRVTVEVPGRFSRNPSGWVLVASRSRYKVIEAFHEESVEEKCRSLSGKVDG